MGPPTLSANTQAVLLLTSPLLTSGTVGAGAAKVLSAREYGQLALRLLQNRHQPADLLNGSCVALLASAPAELDPARLNHLLSRGFQLGQAVEHWANRSITVISRADETYPKRFKQRLKLQAPPLLYACGNLELLNRPALAVVGSRSTPEALLQQTSQLGELSAQTDIVIASGAAKGVDEAAIDVIDYRHVVVAATDAAALWADAHLFFVGHHFLRQCKNPPSDVLGGLIVMLAGQRQSEPPSPASNQRGT